MSALKVIFDKKQEKIFQPEMENFVRSLKSFKVQEINQVKDEVIFYLVLL